MNLLKLPAYYFLGQLSIANLAYSLALVPFAPLGVLLGKRLVSASNPRFYYRLIAMFLVIVGLKLTWNGLAGLTA